MNEQGPKDPGKNPVDSSGIPPRLPSETPPPLTSDDYKLMEDGVTLLPALESLLKHPKRVIFQLNRSGPRPLVVSLLGIVLLCTLVYGIVVGTFSGGQQLWAAALKVAGGTLLSAFICLPSLYIFACLNDLDVKPSAVCGLFFAAIALSSVLLIGFAPVAWIFSQSTHSVAFMGALHLVFWIIGTYFGLAFLYKGLAWFKTGLPGATANLEHLRMWGFIFILVCLQMTTTLRPIVGTAEHFMPAEKKFFLAHWADCLK
ncbi:MAG: hypothetical protein HY360_09200 [Verrucomicrobia bacterium]|nr:hypothetical protein [Verrucomicrobiota bacterium]